MKVVDELLRQGASIVSTDNSGVGILSLAMYALPRPLLPRHELNRIKFSTSNSFQVSTKQSMVET